MTSQSQIDRQVALAAARRAIAKKHGDEALVSTVEVTKYNVISSGSILLDIALGVGGFTRGRLVELFGPPSSGKSTTALETAKNCQILGLPVIYMDYECAFDPEYAGRIGISMDPQLWELVQPDNMEQGLDIAETFIESDVVGLIIFDSLAAMTPKAILEGEFGDKQMAVQARLMSQALQKLVAKVKKSNVVVIFINHIRDILGGQPLPGGRTRKTTPGGSALKFYASVRVELQPMESIAGKILDAVSGTMVPGSVALKVKAMVVKNKVATPYRPATFYLSADRGIHEGRTMLEIALARGVIKQNGSRFILPFRQPGTDKPINLGGQQAVLDYFDSDLDRYDLLRDKIVGLLKRQPEPDKVEQASAAGAPAPAKDMEIGGSENLEETTS